MLFNQTRLGKTEVKAGMILINFSLLNLKKIRRIFCIIICFFGTRFTKLKLYLQTLTRKKSCDDSMAEVELKFEKHHLLILMLQFVVKGDTIVRVQTAHCPCMYILNIMYIFMCILRCRCTEVISQTADTSNLSQRSAIAILLICTHL